MFEDSTFESGGRIKSKSKYWMIATFCINGSILLLLILIPLMDMSVSSLPAKDTASGAGQFNFIRTLSGAIATAIVVAVWEDAIKWNKAVLAGTVQHGQDMLNAIQASGFTEGRARGLFDLAVLQQAAQLGTNQSFLAIGVVLLITAAAVWIAPKPPRHANGNGKPPLGH